MSIEDTLYQTLRDDANVSALVLANGIYRIFKGTPPQGLVETRPYIVLFVVVGRRISTFSGLTGEKMKRVQVDIYDTTENGARTLANHVYTAIEASSMKVGADPTEQYNFEDDTELHHYMIDFEFWV